MIIVLRIIITFNKLTSHIFLLLGCGGVVWFKSAKLMIKIILGVELIEIIEMNFLAENSVFFSS